MRRGGLLCSITSLPSSGGIGDMGPGAYEFVDFLKRSGQSYWQILPLNPVSTTQVNSPYSGISAFAGNPLLISPELLVREKLLSPAEGEYSSPSPPDRVNYHEVEEYKNRIFSIACENFKKMSGKEAYRRFIEENRWWLDDYVLFRALYCRFGRRQLTEWPVEIRRRRPDAIRDAQDTLREECERERFLQYLFHRQWFSLKEYSNAGGVQIIDDIPLYVNCTSSDVWAHPGIFKADEDLAPLGKGGSPPDFSAKRGSSSRAPYTGGMLYNGTGTAGGCGV